MHYTLASQFLNIQQSSAAEWTNLTLTTPSSCLLMRRTMKAFRTKRGNAKQQLLKQHRQTDDHHSTATSCRALTADRLLHCGSHRHHSTSPTGITLFPTPVHQSRPSIYLCRWSCTPSKAGICKATTMHFRASQNSLVCCMRIGVQLEITCSIVDNIL